MTTATADLVNGIAAVAQRLRDYPARVSALAIGVQRLRGPAADPHSARRSAALRREAHALIDDSWALWLEVGRLLDTAAAIPVNPARGPRIGRPDRITALADALDAGIALGLPGHGPRSEP